MIGLATATTEVPQPATNLIVGRIRDVVGFLVLAVRHSAILVSSQPPRSIAFIALVLGRGKVG